jgi:hypothetical protein
MDALFYHKHLHVGAHHRVWLFVAALVAFLLAALWAQPVH